MGYLNNRLTVTLKAGLSAEICLAKYIAFKRKAFYIGYQQGAPRPTPNFLRQTLQFIHKEYTSNCYDNGSGTALFGPGICSVPYIVETGDIMYLPSQFLVGVDSIDELQTCIDTANQQGYKCYGVVGYDPFIPDKLCTWIKLSHPPQEYQDILSFHKISNLIIMSVHDKKGIDHGGERCARVIRGNKIEGHCQPEAGQIYLMFVNQSYGQPQQKDIEIFSRVIKDRPKEYWVDLASKPIVNFMHDWQSGIDCIKSIEHRFQPLKLNFFYITHPDSWNLYLCAYHLGKQFIFHNYEKDKHEVAPQGVVFNQYFMNSPTYELNYGWVPIMYWQWYPQNAQRITALLSEEEKGLPRWFNMHPGTQNALMTSSLVKIVTNHEGKKLGEWITKYAPIKYDLKYLNIEQIHKCLSVHGLICTQL